MERFIEEMAGDLDGIVTVATQLRALTTFNRFKKVEKKSLNVQPHSNSISPTVLRYVGNIRIKSTLNGASV